jgi:hypothetical protein
MLNTNEIKRNQKPKEDCMKYSICVLALFVMASSAFAWNDEYEINTDPFAPRIGSSVGIEMRRRYDYDPANKYRGEIDSYGSVRMRNLNGDILRGHIDNDGYGRLYDLNGNSYRVKPR